MGAFSESLCDHVGLVRIGALARAYGDPYDYSLTYVIRGEYAEPVGFEHKQITPTDFKDIIRSINQATGKLVAYDRAGPPWTRVVQIDPKLTKGRIVMAIDRSHLSKTHIPSPARAQKRDGSINMKTVAIDAKKAFEAF